MLGTLYLKNQWKIRTKRCNERPSVVADLER
jgi:hypothetical protein